MLSGRATRGFFSGSWPRSRLKPLLSPSPPLSLSLPTLGGATLVRFHRQSKLALRCAAVNRFMCT